MGMYKAEYIKENTGRSNTVHEGMKCHTLQSRGFRPPEVFPRKTLDLGAKQTSLFLRSRLTV